MDELSIGLIASEGSVHSDLGPRVWGQHLDGRIMSQSWLFHGQQEVETVTGKGRNNMTQEIPSMTYILQLGANP